MNKHYLASASFGIAVKQEIPNLFRDALLPVRERAGLEFFIYPKGFLIISCLRHGISHVDAGPEGRQILVRIKGTDTFWVLEATVASQAEKRVAHHAIQASSIIAVIQSLRLCENYSQFQARAWTICASWKTDMYLNMPRSQFVFDGRQLNFLSSQAYYEMNEGDLGEEIQRFLRGEEIAGAHFLQLVLRKGLWSYLSPKMHQLLDGVAEGVGLNSAHAFDGTDLTERWLTTIASELARVLRSERETTEKDNGESAILPS